MNAGDIIVLINLDDPWLKSCNFTTVGSMHKLQSYSGSSAISTYDSSNYVLQKSCFRLATPDEVLAFTRGIRNIKDITISDNSGYQDGDLLEIVDSGEGMHPGDKGKKVRFVSSRPFGVPICNEFYSTGIYYEFLPGESYAVNPRGVYKYGNCGSSMVKKANSSSSFASFGGSISEKLSDYTGKYFEVKQDFVNSLTCKKGDYLYMFDEGRCKTISNDLVGYLSAPWIFIKNGSLVLMSESFLPPKKAGNFIIGSWYKHSFYPLPSGTHSAYVRVCGANKSYDGTYTNLSFDKIICQKGNVFDKGYTQANSEWERAMVLVSDEEALSSITTYSSTPEHPILSEVKRKFPIGCRVQTIYSDGSKHSEVYTIKPGDYDRFTDYDSSFDVVSHSGMFGYLYNEGKWASVYTEPVEPSRDITTNLPSKWCIKRDSDPHLINSWFAKYGNYEGLAFSSGYLHYPKPSGIQGGSSSIISGYTELTLQEFKDLVVNGKQSFLAGNGTDTYKVATKQTSSKPSDNLEFQNATIVKKNKNKSKLVIIN